MANERELRRSETRSIYQLYIDYVRHENELLNHRTTWFLAIETILIAAAGYLLLEYFESISSHIFGSPDSPFSHIVEFMLAWSILCTFGLVTALAGRRSIRAALDAQDSLTNFWIDLSKGLEGASDLPDLMGGKLPSARKDGGRLADRLVHTVLLFWGLCTVFLVSLAVVFAT